ncbi:hypothetical protein BDY17DRAFT_299798 [Neohortaea acidophila]|uniref:Tr-type G domain-containing protein n=1 Tax=Neohortaea acidophila TaxID=245834 RepID=A0A6A6PPW3_9PEZI|nr:uncharacterized protein BDY17DRAFT_299798 [Neohortaea acidophila]KAF2481836.1 hypothetical protein BDY17DRAFT_299798 [Neohortaea acidophila]
MASIFTFDPDPPRVDSPWLRGVGGDGKPQTELSSVPDKEDPRHGKGDKLARSLRNIRLEAEPQEGPVEYKLHLLLRPRRRFIYASTSTSGRSYSVYGEERIEPFADLERSRVAPGPASEASTPPLGSTYQTRQHRLQQLTTQLLWRLQQSSPHHSSSATNIILPSLPEPLPELNAPDFPARLVHGLEESKGALYEIGVADDGTLVGLTEDEMQESLNNLRAMAACLGCAIEILRREVVGECEWIESVHHEAEIRRTRHTGNLIVVEAMVKPLLQPVNPDARSAKPENNGLHHKTESAATHASTEQLRVTLTGPTMSGKSSLLGTLTMSTLDNGRGQSRISMLKHRHEISSGVTSSVTQELIGYADEEDVNAKVINYAAENTASWIDIHVGASSNRLVFISDSAGHPRYRRTILRGLVGWAPHWTLLCVPVDDTDFSVGRDGNGDSSQQHLGLGKPDLDLSQAQLDLCLTLKLPLVIVITKLDLASKSGLKITLSKILDTLKAAGRKPAIFPRPAANGSEDDLQSVSGTAIDAAYDVVLPLLNDPLQAVPIVLTSAVRGTGIDSLHALLHELPIPAPSATSSPGSGFLFHIEDVYTRPAGEEGVIVSGRMRQGKIGVNDICSIGPSSIHEQAAYEDNDHRQVRRPQAHLPTSRSFPGAYRDTKLLQTHIQPPGQVWLRCRVSTIRNLRLPVPELSADQVGTLAIVPIDTNWSSNGLSGIRKGMVVSSIQPQATRTFVAEFKREDLTSLAVGNHVVVYIASVRASARIVSARTPDSPIATMRGESDGSQPFDFEELQQPIGDVVEEETQRESATTIAGAVTAPHLLVTFAFDAAREFVLVGDQVLVMPGGGPGLYGGQERGEKGIAGLEGFVGRIAETYP